MKDIVKMRYWILWFALLWRASMTSAQVLTSEGETLPSEKLGNFQSVSSLGVFMNDTVHFGPYGVPFIGAAYSYGTGFWLNGTGDMTNAEDRDNLGVTGFLSRTRKVYVKVDSTRISLKRVVGDTLSRLLMDGGEERFMLLEGGLGDMRSGFSTYSEDASLGAKLYTSDEFGIVEMSSLSIDTSAIGIKFMGNSTVSFQSDGNVGIGTTSPEATLDVEGSFRLNGNGAGEGRVLISDENGFASWSDVGNLVVCQPTKRINELPESGELYIPYVTNFIIDVGKSVSKCAAVFPSNPKDGQLLNIITSSSTSIDSFEVTSKTDKIDGVTIYPLGATVTYVYVADVKTWFRRE